MSIWPFANRATAKPKRSAPPPAASQPGKPNVSEENPAEGGVISSPKRRTSRLQKTPSPTPRRGRVQSDATPPALAKEAQHTSPRAAAPPLDPIALASPMDVDFSAARRPRASTGGSAGEEKGITALPGSKTLRTSPHLRPVTQDTADIPYNWNLRSGSHHSLPSNQNPQRRGKLQRNPSRNKRSAQHESPLARRRSSKKRRNDPLREEEIRAMSAPIDVPKRGTDNGIMNREDRKSRGHLNRNLERPTSTVSLPFEESIHSSMSGEAEQRNYRLSVLDVMSPRPTIRFRDMSKTYATDSPSSKLLRQTSRSDRPSGKAVQVRPNTDETRRERIDSLADEMDSTELRDILERDRKRKERKREREAERLKRKLEKRAEEQRTKEWLAQQAEAVEASNARARPAPDALDAAETVHEEQKNTYVAEEADFRMEDLETTETPAVSHDLEKPPIPLEDIHPAFRHQYQGAQKVPSIVGKESMATLQQPETPLSKVETSTEIPALDTARTGSYTTTRPITPLTPVTSTVYHGDRVKASKILGTDVAGGSYTVSNTALDEASRPKDASPNKPTIITRLDEAERNESETPLSTSKKRNGFFASLFRGGRRTVSEAPRDAPTPETSFSSTSREEMSRNIPAHLVHEPSNSTSFKKSGLPLRTTSIFREDLPESLLAPSESRGHAPTDISTSRRGMGARRAHIPSAIMSEGSLRIDSLDDEVMRTPTSPPLGNTSRLLSQSLASVDSEGSWLSGKSPRSTSRAQKHTSYGGSSLGRREEYQGSFEELGMPEDEYFRRLNAPVRSSEPRTSNLSVAIANSQHASSAALRNPNVDTETNLSGSTAPLVEEGQIIPHAGASRQPVVVHGDARYKSSEGLLNDYLSSSPLQSREAGTEDNKNNNKMPDAEYPTPAETPTEGRSSEDTMPIQRATSVNLGKGHARNLSAGSAKLLEITRRGSASLSATPNPPATPQMAQFSLHKEGSGAPTANDP
ncbi:uncharacterized protein PV09_08022 [Verruconis gallopava]|uniref:Uncharacterized protein n=1 Tax=Verruconis gallopava TaxID=253628 RepID=A0A0D1YI59_9PEZI|nr:uncharacterized protein PV09_08022 [Verruconis gallopava]KIW00502.1 hypothetical protein PV09_08022 [Verruconis gallopava]